MWKKFKLKRAVMSLLLVLGLVFTSISPLGVRAEETGGTKGRDMSALLKEANPDIDISIKQGSEELASGAAIDYTIPVRITAKKIAIPLVSDVEGAAITEDKYIKAGDKASFVLGKVKLPEGVTITGGTDDIASDNGEVVGKFTVKRNPLSGGEEEIVAELSFAEDKEEIFKTKKNMTVGVWADFELKNIVNPPQPGTPEQTITIFDKTFKIGKEKTKTEMTKSAKVDYNKAKIDWTVTVEGKGQTSGQSLSLAGYKFIDDLTVLGHIDSNNNVENPYIAGSFRIKNKSGDTIYTGDPDILNRNHEPDEKGTVIAKVLPEGTPDYVIFEFSTLLKPWDMKDKGTIKTNTAELFDKVSVKDRVDQAATSVAVVADWGTKKAIKQYEKDNYYYAEWEIIFKGNNKALRNVVIEDVPPYDIYKQSQLEFVSSKISKRDNAESEWELLREYGEDKQYKMPGDHKYKLSDYGITVLNGDIKLEVVSRISKEDAPVRMTFKNEVNVAFGENQELKGEIWGLAEIGPIRSILKSVKNAQTAGDRDYVSYETEWEVGVENDAIADGKTYVYDPIIYDASIGTSSDPSKFEVYEDGNETALPLDVGKTLSEIMKGTLLNIKHNIYEKDSFKIGMKADGGQHNIADKTYELRYDGKPVGHLIEVKFNEQEKNADGSVKVYTDDTKKEKYRQSFSFKTKIVSSKLLVQTKDGRNTNIAAFVRTIKGKQWITYAGAWPWYTSRMFKKQVLKTDAAKKVYQEKENAAADNINNDNIDKDKDNSGALTNSYNKWDRSILYRLSVNAEGVNGISDYTEKVRVFDEMPSGWDFDKINEEDFLIYRGKTSANLDLTSSEAYVEADGKPLPKSEWEKFLEFSKEKSSDKIRATFNFKKLEGPYVILIKARLTDEGLLGPDSKLLNKDGSVINNASLFMGNTFHADDSQKVAYDTKFLTKIFKENEAEGTVKDLTWTIGYAPYNLPKAVLDKMSEPNAKVELVDVLDKGMDIKKDADGNLSFDRGYYILTEKWTDEFGQTHTNVYKDKTLENEKVVTYDKDKRELKVKLKNPLHEYEFSYITVITANQGEVISNTVKVVVNGETQHQEVKQVYTVKNSGANIHWEDAPKTDINIYKVDGQGAALSGAEFELTRPDNPSFKQKSVLENDKLKFKELFPGEYKLKETKAPSNKYELTGKSYTFVIKKLDDKSFIVSFDDINGEIEKLENDVLGIKVYNYKKAEKTDLKLLKADLEANKDIVTKSGITLGAIKMPLDGARFRLTLKSDPAVSYSGITGTATTGGLTFNGVKTGIYTLTEEAAPAGYTSLIQGYEIIVTASAIKSEFAIKDAKDGEIREVENTVVVFNKKTPTPPGPNPPGPNPPGPNPPGPVVPVVPVDPTPTDPNVPTDPTVPVDPDPTPLGPAPTTPVTPSDPDEDITVDEDDTPQGGSKGKRVKGNDPDEDIVIDEDDTPQGGIKIEKKLPKTGGTDTMVYYAGGAMLLLLAAGVAVIRRKKI